MLQAIRVLVATKIVATSMVRFVVVEVARVLMLAAAVLMAHKVKCMVVVIGQSAGSCDFRGINWQ